MVFETGSRTAEIGGRVGQGAGVPRSRSGVRVALSLVLAVLLGILVLVVAEPAGAGKEAAVR